MPRGRADFKTEIRTRRGAVMPGDLKVSGYLWDYYLWDYFFGTTTLRDDS
jgi:hypothetical protein